MTTSNHPACSVSLHTTLATQRLWIVSVGWTLLLAAFVLLLLKASWGSLTVGIPMLMVLLWLFSLHLVGQKPPASLLRLDIAGLARYVLGGTRAAFLRALDGVPAPGSGHSPTAHGAEQGVSV